MVGDIPEDKFVKQAVQQQRPVLEAYPSCAAARAFKHLASVATRWPLPAGPSGRLEFFLERMLTRTTPRLKVIT
jgi:flagellar biosynthesis protein FlhG